MENNKNGSRRIKSQEREVSFQWFVVNILIHWKWFLLSIIVFLLGGYLYLRYATSIYSVETSVVLKDNKRGGLSNSELSVFETLGWLESNNNVENELEILHSRNLIENVVVEQGLYIQYYIKGRFKNTELYGNSNRKFYFSSPIKIFTDSKIISSLETGIFLHISLTDYSTIFVEGTYGSEEFSSEYSSLPAVLQTPVGEVLLLNDENSTLKKEYPLEVSIIPPLWVAQRYMALLSMELTSKNTTVIKLALKETHSKRGEDFLSKLIDLYNRDTMNDKNKAARNASRFISDRIIGLNKDLLVAEKEVEDYKQENHISDIEFESQVFVKGDDDYMQKLIQVETQILLLSYLEEEVDNTENLYRLLPAAIGRKQEKMQKINEERKEKTNKDKEKVRHKKTKKSI